MSDLKQKLGEVMVNADFSAEEIRLVLSNLKDTKGENATSFFPASLPFDHKSRSVYESCGISVEITQAALDTLADRIKNEGASELKSKVCEILEEEFTRNAKIRRVICLLAGPEIVDYVGNRRQILGEDETKNPTKNIGDAFKDFLKNLGKDPEGE